MTAADLNVDNVSWARKAGETPILHPTSFSLNAGRVLGVVGANGAGKTTLLRLIYRFTKPTTGTVRIGGEDIWSISPRACACKVAAVLQEQPSDFALSVREIIALGRIPHHSGFAGPSRRDAEIVDSALERLNLAPFANRSFGTLSGGERQRCMVARALVQEPQLLVLDEPTNHLDIRHQLEVLQMIGDLDMTIVTSLHDLNMAAQVCDDILVLRHGQTMGFGAPYEVLTSERVTSAFGVYARSEELSLSARQHLTFHLQQ